MSDLRSVFSFLNGVFDLDGTLVDSIPTFCAVFTDCLAPYGIDRAEAERFYRASTGQPMEKQFSDILESYGLSVSAEEVMAVRQKADADFLMKEVSFFHGARALVRLREFNWSYNFLSSAASDENVRKRLTQGRIMSCFTQYCGSTALPKGPEHIAAFAAVVGVPVEVFADKAFFCGDGATDMRIGKAHGMYSIGIAGTVSAECLFDAGADRVVLSISELLDDDM